jgi:hypothetical protein
MFLIYMNGGFLSLVILVLVMHTIPLPSIGCSSFKKVQILSWQSHWHRSGNFAEERF